MIHTKQIISLNISLIGYSSALEHLIKLAKERAPAYACFANAHMTIEAYQSRSFADQVNRANLVLADGMPLVKSIKLLYGVSQDRIAGMDVFPDLLKLAERNELSVYFFGTTNDMLEKIKTKAQKQFPTIQIAGMFSPPFDKPLQNEDYIQQIINSKANIVFIALGCPKQEMWMADNSSKINALLLGVGGAFPIYAETNKRAPLFMRNAGLEWMYRLMQEPKRLFKRYLVTNTLYLYLIARVKLRMTLNLK